MTHPRSRDLFPLYLVTSAALFLAGCSTSATTPSATPPLASVVVSGPPSTRLGASAQFTAAVSNAASQAVQWQVNSIAGGNATDGLISSTGLYTAPAAMPASATVTITAVSQAASTASGALSESLLNPLPILTSGTATQAGSSLNYLVDLLGTGFVPTSTIQAAGAAQSTTFISATELEATVSVPSGTSSLAVTVTNPDPGGSTSNILTLPLAYQAATPAAAARILDQTTFGPTSAAIQHVQQIGVDAYLQEQFAQPTTQLAAISTNPLPAACVNDKSAYPCAESEWWFTAINGPDQLRQRVAFALSEIFVVSTQAIPGQAIPQFHNALANDAFGNFSTVMHDVALSPAMGLYLNMLDSAAPAPGEIANENFARENMQLFTLGLNLLNQDGSLQLDSSGNPIPAYTQDQVQAFALAYTGWTYASSTGGSPSKFPNTKANFADPMAAVESAHANGAKTLLNNTVLTAGQTAEDDLSQALANIFNLPNIGPFVCKQLIQHLVTSTPSPAYVSRVAAAFANNGSGVRGDMKAVLTAILTDEEARSGDTNPSFNGGHLREPILFLTAMVRALGFQNTNSTGSYDSLSNYSNILNQRPYRANSVFNFFPPGYVIPATHSTLPSSASKTPPPPPSANPSPTPSSTTRSPASPSTFPTPAPSASSPPTRPPLSPHSTPSSCIRRCR